jgi:hypothetical protein
MRATLANGCFGCFDAGVIRTELHPHADSRSDSRARVFLQDKYANGRAGISVVGIEDARVMPSRWPPG